MGYRKQNLHKTKRAAALRKIKICDYTMNFRDSISGMLDVSE